MKMFEKSVYLAERLAKVATVLTNLVLSLSVLGLVYFIFKILRRGCLCCSGKNAFIMDRKPDR